MRAGEDGKEEEKPTTEKPQEAKEEPEVQKEEVKKTEPKAKKEEAEEKKGPRVSKTVSFFDELDTDS